MLCSRCSAQLSQHAFKLPNWLISAPLNSTCCSACAAPRDDENKSKWIAWVNPEGRMRFPFLQWFRENSTPSPEGGSCAKKRLLLYVMWRSESRFHVFLLQLVLKNSWYEACFETKHEKKSQAKSCRMGRNKNKLLCDLRKVQTKLMLFCLCCTSSCRTSALLWARSGLLLSRRSLSHDVNELMMGLRAWKEFLTRRSRYCAGRSMCDSGRLQATLAQKNLNLSVKGRSRFNQEAHSEFIIGKKRGGKKIKLFFLYFPANLIVWFS